MWWVPITFSILQQFYSAELVTWIVSWRFWSDGPQTSFIPKKAMHGSRNNQQTQTILPNKDPSKIKWPTDFAWTPGPSGKFKRDPFVWLPQISNSKHPAGWQKILFIKLVPSCSTWYVTYMCLTPPVILKNKRSTQSETTNQKKTVYIHDVARNLQLHHFIFRLASFPKSNSNSNRDNEEESRPELTGHWGQVVGTPRGGGWKYGEVTVANPRLEPNGTAAMWATLFFQQMRSWNKNWCFMVLLHVLHMYMHENNCILHANVLKKTCVTCVYFLKILQ